MSNREGERPFQGSVVTSSVPGSSLRFHEISALEVPVPLSILTLSLVDSPVTKEEGRKILERHDYRCQYCGLDGRASFENALVMRVDFNYSPRP